MGRFICRNCSFRFEADKIKKECPYCGEETLAVEPSAEDLVESS